MGAAKIRYPGRSHVVVRIVSCGVNVVMLLQGCRVRVLFLSMQSSSHERSFRLALSRSHLQYMEIRSYHYI
jgi:hypothetical protein